MIAGAVLLIALLGAPRAATATVTEIHYVMGTYFRITAAHNDDAAARAALRRCFTTARSLEARFSRYDSASELSYLNADDHETITVSTEMAALLRRALHLQVATRGAFDVSVGALTRLWRTTTDWPAPAAIEETRHAAGAGAFDVFGTTVRRLPGVVIDLDGIAKGWAVDRCVAELRAAGIERAFLSFGESSLYALGAPAGAKGWTVVLRGLDASRALGTLTLRDQAASVSAVFGHERLVGSRRIGHIVDPRSGLPLMSPAMAVVVAASAADAEAFSKALLIRGDTLPGTGMIGGALLIRPGRVKRQGRIAFVPFHAAQPIAAAAEALR